MDSVAHVEVLQTPILATLGRRPKKISRIKRIKTGGDFLETLENLFHIYEACFVNVPPNRQTEEQAGCCCPGCDPTPSSFSWIRIHTQFLMRADINGCMTREGGEMFCCGCCCARGSYPLVAPILFPAKRVMFPLISNQHVSFAKSFLILWRTLCFRIRV